MNLGKSSQLLHALLETTPTSLSKSEYIDLGKTIACPNEITLNAEKYHQTGA